MSSYHFMKYLIELELIMNDEKQKRASDTPEIESQLSVKKKKKRKKTHATNKATQSPNPKAKLKHMKQNNEFLIITLQLSYICYQVECWVRTTQPCPGHNF